MKRSSQFTITITLAAVAVCIILVFLAWLHIHYMALSSGQGEFERFSALGTMLAGIGGILAFVVLVIYTAETYLLRKTSERQFEAAELPILLFSMSFDNSPSTNGGQSRLPQLLLSNIGTGAAFDVTIQSLRKNEVEAKFSIPEGAYVGSKSEVAPELRLSDPEASQGLFALAKLQGLFENGKLPSETIVKVEFSSLTGKRYTTKNIVRYDADKNSLASKFIPPMDECG